MLVVQVDAPYRPAVPAAGEVLHARVVAARAAPALDAVDVGGQFAQPRVLVWPDVTVAGDSVGAGVGFVAAYVEG